MRTDYDSHSVRVSGLANRLRQGGLLLVLLVIGLAPVPFGAYQDWSRFLFSCLLSTGAFFWLWSALLDGGFTGFRRLLAVPAACFALFLGWGVLQCAPTESGSLFHPFWEMAEKALEIPLQKTVSLTCDRGVEQLYYYLGCGMLLWVVIDYAKQESRARNLLVLIVVFGVGNALYGLIVHWLSIEKVLWFDKRYFLGDVTGTLLYRNHYGAYMGLVLLCLLALFTGKVVGSPVLRLRGNLRRERLVEAVFTQWNLYLIGFFLLLAALLGSHSRGGLVSTVLGIAGYFVLMMGNSSARRGSSGTGYFSIFMSILLIAGILYGGVATLSRLDDSSWENSTRDEAYQLTWIAIQDNPWLGYGIGSYKSVFKMYQGSGNQYHLPVNTVALNSYLELAFEAGIPAASVLLVSLVWLVGLCCRGVWVRRRNWHYPALAVAASILLGTHALVDYSFQLPAIAWLYLAVLAIGVAQSSPTRTGT